ncbi:Mitochondrial carrier domain-containing protein [Artemisia annua]|uniref:Mitochondrial carrier domain-containing protein n=1 Tax=Artemisia annua TaxID=35608 RepID=A0A2U1PU02_ARTAN|nr:Mitochondrial carrier domain-containing protein [Artemisia annua]
MGVKNPLIWWASPLKVASHFGSSGVDVAAATGVTHPLDVHKVRQQMQRVRQKGPFSGMVWWSAICHKYRAVRREGAWSLFLVFDANIFMKIASGSCFWCFCHFADQPYGSFKGEILYVLKFEPLHILRNEVPHDRTNHFFIKVICCIAQNSNAFSCQKFIIVTIFIHLINETLVVE